MGAAQHNGFGLTAQMGSKKLPQAALHPGALQLCSGRVHAPSDVAVSQAPPGLWELQAPRAGLCLLVGLMATAGLSSGCLPSPGSLRDWSPLSRTSVVMGGQPSGPVQPHLVFLTRLQAPWGFLVFDSKVRLCSRVEAEGFLWGSCRGRLSP